MSWTKMSEEPKKRGGELPPPENTQITLSLREWKIIIEALEENSDIDQDCADLVEKLHNKVGY